MPDTIISIVADGFFFLFIFFYILDADEKPTLWDEDNYVKPTKI